MSDFENVTNTIDEILTEFEDFRTKMQTLMQEKFNIAISAFFKEFPEVKTIYWTQYTPYFNDGEECVFSVHEPYFSTTEWQDVESPWGEEDEGLIEATRYDYTKRQYVAVEGVRPELASAIAKMKRIIEGSEDIMRVLYDDHVWVRLYDGGAEVDEYCHD